MEQHRNNTLRDASFAEMSEDISASKWATSGIPYNCNSIDKVQA